MERELMSLAAGAAELDHGGLDGAHTIRKQMHRAANNLRGVLSTLQARGLNGPPPPEEESAMTDLPATSTCRHPDCAAPVLWVRTLRGRLMPLDMAPVPFAPGVMTFVENDVVRAAVATDAGPFFTSHFDTCEYAEEFRSSRR